jgi:hypothetical protein
MHYPTYLMSLHHLMCHLQASILYSKLQSFPSRPHRVAQSTKNFHLNKDFNITFCRSYFMNCKYTQADNTYSFSIMQ